MKSTKTKIIKIKFTKKEQEEIDLINKGQPVPKSRIVTNKNGYTYEYTTNKRFSYTLARKRLVELYGGGCSACGNWPSYKVSHDVGDKNQGAWLVYRFCQKHYEEWQQVTKK